MTRSHWRKSSYSGQESNCVELADSNDMIRDSKNLEALALSRRAVGGLVEAVRTGRV